MSKQEIIVISIILIVLALTIIPSLVYYFHITSKQKIDFNKKYQDFFNSLDEIKSRNKEDIIRNQGLFREQIAKMQIGKSSLNNGNVSRKDLIEAANCLACNFPFFLIGSHIYRFADIKTDYQKGVINKEEAEEFKAAGYNGFFLCPNHDKMFEYGYIYFSLNTNTFRVNKNLDEDKRVLIEKTLRSKPYKVNQNDYEKFKFCVLKHQERLNIVDYE